MRFGRSKQSPKPPAQPVGKPPQQITPMPMVPGTGEMPQKKPVPPEISKAMTSYNAEVGRQRPITTMPITPPDQRTQSFKNMIFGVPMANKSMQKGGVVKSSASKRADGIATKGKTKGRMV